jgi:hypothetical protein
MLEDIYKNRPQQVLANNKATVTSSSLFGQKAPQQTAQGFGQPNASAVLPNFSA